MSQKKLYKYSLLWLLFMAIYCHQVILAAQLTKIVGFCDCVLGLNLGDSRIVSVVDRLGLFCVFLGFSHFLNLMPQSQPLPSFLFLSFHFSFIHSFNFIFIPFMFRNNRLGDDLRCFDHVVGERPGALHTDSGISKPEVR